MRIKNHYIRNKHYCSKHWNRIRIKSHPFETMMPWFYYSSQTYYPTEEQIANHFDWIDKQARALESGHHLGLFHAPKDYRKMINRGRSAKVKHIMDLYRLGDYDAEIPKFKNDADWDYF